ncbi:hypothetical protein N2152v2_010389 [Parachlorella kessleri]
MASGRVYALLIASSARQVVFERFYDNFSEPEKAEIRSAFDQVASEGRGAIEAVGRYKNGKIVMMREGDVLFFALGTGEYNELALGELLRLLIVAYKDIFRSTLTDTVLLQNFGQTALVVDELCKEGLVDLTDSQSIQKAIALRLPTDGGTAPSSKVLTRLFSAAPGSAS